MSEETSLRDRLRKIEALFAGAATPGERDAAAAALDRIKLRLAEFGVREKPMEMQFSLVDLWSQRLFIALCRRYGLRPYRRYRQRHTTVMLQVPRAFADEILWPEYLELNNVLRTYLLAVTSRLIRDHVHADTSDVEEIAGILPGANP